MATTENTEHLHFWAAIRSGGIVVVEIGPEHVRYDVHKALLTKHSEYFRGALTGSWQEAQDGKVTLEDVETGPFNIFVHWLYSREIPNEDYKWVYAAEIKEKNRNCQSQIAVLTALKSVVLGDRLLASEFRRQAHNWMVEYLVYGEWDLARNQTIIYAFKNLSSDDKLLDLFAQLHARNFKEDRDGTKLDSELPYAFLLSCLRKMAWYRAEIMDEIDISAYLYKDI